VIIAFPNGSHGIEARLTVGCGEIFGLIDPNGARKSTLIKMLTTLLPPSSGRALVAGFDVVKRPGQVRKHIGYVPQLLSADGSSRAMRIYCCRRASMLFRRASGRTVSPMRSA
jgi:ABC-type Mn2+/Zn2+ transport system ATPase subunit